MFYFRIDRVRFLDNGAVKSGLGVFGHDFAKVKFLSFVTPANQSLPDVDRWVRENDANAKRAALESLVSTAVNARALTEIDRVQDNVDIPFGDTGLVLFQSEEIPEEFTWTFIAVRSKKEVREAAMTVDEIVGERGSGSLSSSVLSLLKKGTTAANPAYAAGLAVAEFVAKAGARRLMKKGDKQLGYVASSFIRSVHYPMGIREAKGVRDSTGNMIFDYSIFGYKRAIPVIR